MDKSTERESSQNTMGNTKQHQTQSKLSKLKIFQLCQKHFATIGISPNLVMQAYPINVKIFMAFVMNHVTIISNLVYVVREAKTFAEFTQSIYFISMALLIIFALMIIILKVDKLFELIENFDRMVNTSKYQIYCG